MDLRVQGGLVIPESELGLRFTPSGGPGGQHANRSNTRVELWWDISTSSAVDQLTRDRLVGALGPVIRVVVDEERSQTRNRDLARRRLASRVENALHVPKQRRKTKPSRGSQRRRVEGKRQRSQLKKQRRRPSADD
ncbi:MAG: alternative ribosome rescue aminoacyl-tRNA hydrolase ArfB [Acidimicrobiales bacterium]